MAVLGGKSRKILAGHQLRCIPYTRVTELSEVSDQFSDQQRGSQSLQTRESGGAGKGSWIGGRLMDDLCLCLSMC